MVVFTPYFPNSDGGRWFPDITAIDNTAFTINSRQPVDNIPVRWISIGY